MEGLKGRVSLRLPKGLLCVRAGLMCCHVMPEGPSGITCLGETQGAHNETSMCRHGMILTKKVVMSA